MHNANFTLLHDSACWLLLHVHAVTRTPPYLVTCLEPYPNPYLNPYLPLYLIKKKKLIKLIMDFNVSAGAKQ